MTIHRPIMAAMLAAVAASPAWAERVPEDKLKALIEVMPPAPDGFARDAQIGAYSSDSASSATATYRSADGRSFSVAITFSKANARQNAELLADRKKADLFGMETKKLKGRDVLVKKADNQNKFTTAILAVLNDTRIVSVTDSTGKTERAVLQAAFESADLDAIAKK